MAANLANFVKDKRADRLLQRLLEVANLPTRYPLSTRDTPFIFNEHLRFGRHTLVIQASSNRARTEVAPLPTAMGRVVSNMLEEWRQYQVQLEGHQMKMAIEHSLLDAGDDNDHDDGTEQFQDLATFVYEGNSDDDDPSPSPALAPGGGGGRGGAGGAGRAGAGDAGSTPPKKGSPLAGQRDFDERGKHAGPGNPVEDLRLAQSSYLTETVALLSLYTISAMSSLPKDGFAFAHIAGVPLTLFESRTLGTLQMGTFLWDNIIVVAFRETTLQSAHSVLQAMTRDRDPMNINPSFPNAARLPREVKIQRHLLELCTSMHPSLSVSLGRVLLDTIERINRKEHGARRRRLLLTGHSIGGACATLALAMMLNEPGGVAAAISGSLVTFGSPRVGCPNFAMAMEKAGRHIRLRMTRFVHTGPGIYLWTEDPVTKVPASNGWLSHDFKHVGYAMELISRKISGDKNALNSFKQYSQMLLTFFKWFRPGAWRTLNATPRLLWTHR